jgi:hypothetical protein
MTKLDQLRNEMRREVSAMKLRIADLEARPARRKREPAPRPADADMDERDKWYADYLEAELMYGGGRVILKRAKAFLAREQRVDIRAVHKFLSRIDKQPIKRDSGQYIRVRDAILAETAKLKNHDLGKVHHVFRVRAAG